MVLGSTSTNTSTRVVITAVEITTLPSNGTLTDNNGNEDPGPVLSSPLIGENSRIYVTTPMGLYEIK